MLIVCYTALLAPVLGFVNFGFMRFSLVADHWQHAAMIVPCAVLAGVATTLARRYWNPTAANVAAWALLGALAWLTWLQAANYADAETSYRAMIQRNPACWMAYDNLGKVLDDRGDVAGAAFDYYQKALELNPSHAGGADSNAGAFWLVAEKSTRRSANSSGLCNSAPTSPRHTAISARRWPAAVRSTRPLPSIGKP